ncbi:AAA-type ATPase lid domain-containing protein [Hydrogenophaga aquatica]
MEDIPALADCILQRLAQRDGRLPPTLTQDAVAALQTHAFRGNVRELENLLERSVALSDGTELGVEDLFLAQQAGRPQQAGGVLPEAPDLPAGEPSPANILKVLEAHRWNRTRAAEALGMTLRQLRYRLAKMNAESGDVLSRVDN